MSKVPVFKIPPLISLFVLLATPVFSQDWKTDIDAALAQAAGVRKDVLLFFTVSEHCDNCDALSRRVFSTPEFADFAKENYVLVKVDFSQKSNDEPSEKMVRKNLLIVEKYNKDGFFPLVVVLGKDGRAKGKIGVYQGETPAQFINQLRKIKP